MHEIHYTNLIDAKAFAVEKFYLLRVRKGATSIEIVDRDGVVFFTL
ncbi:MAG: hypothetical protein QM676_02215 [Novosphingobium sp.]